MITDYQAKMMLGHDEYVKWIELGRPDIEADMDYRYRNIYGGHKQNSLKNEEAVRKIEREYACDKPWLNQGRFV